MIKKEFVQIMAAIESAYNTKFDKMKASLYFDNLSDLEYMKCQKAVKKLMQTSEYPPTIAAIRKAYNEVTGVKNVNSVEVIAALNKVAKIGRYRQEEGWKWLEENNPTAYKILDAIGYTNYCNSNPAISCHLVEKMVKEIAKEENSSLMLERHFANDITALQSPVEADY